MASIAAPLSLDERLAEHLANERCRCLRIITEANDLPDYAREQLAAKLDSDWVRELVLMGDSRELPSGTRAATTASSGVERTEGSTEEDKVVSASTGPTTLSSASRGARQRYVPRKAWLEWCLVALQVGKDYPLEVRRRRSARTALH